ncbi:related to phosphatidylglycerophosphate synthase PEL1 [Phialocephala subalpina]|uniref:CDP-diacylglycerol--glycerol-3-phosphate 3-phosphatidyltransferase n=1 Tax=Phialocephala subalpina TaxID=576137 RepID=A0A1L7X4X6_9HELO|nr:related to phosphatidylglycerophosphate synthase PEL1 [Phialocephala subalpina]
MIIRSTLRCSAVRRLPVYRARLLQAKPRRYSTSAPLAQPPSSSPASMLGPFTNELDRIAPKFEIQGSQINVLRTPSEFYETLKSKILSAEKRIFLSTLYIGKTEHELIATLQQALRAKPKLKLSILTDALRGTRESPEPSCASLLAPLVLEFGEERVEIRMYHTPNLTGLRKKYIPKRINEGWGLQHMKLYGMDDEIIISGKSLKRLLHKPPRQIPRLLLKRDNKLLLQPPHRSLTPQLPRHALRPRTSRLHPRMAHLEPRPLTTHFTIRVHHSILQTPETAHPTYRYLNNSIVHQYHYLPNLPTNPSLPPSTDASTELPSITSILTTISHPSYVNSSWTFTAGYFNPDPSLTSLLLSTSSRNNTVITASPWANGFYGSKGVSGLLPAAYTLLSRRFLERVQKSGREGDIILKEWRRGTVGEKEGWTYHAKGLWVSLNKNEDAKGEKGMVSIVGSSNYTKRSYSLDLETGVAIVTKDEGLIKRLGEERDGLGDEKWAREVGMDEFIKTDRRVSWRVRVAMWIVGVVGGAL